MLLFFNVFIIVIKIVNDFNEDIEFKFNYLSFMWFEYQMRNYIICKFDICVLLFYVLLQLFNDTNGFNEAIEFKFSQICILKTLVCITMRSITFHCIYLFFIFYFFLLFSSIIAVI